MNWRRGLIRIWIAISIGVVAFVGLVLKRDLYGAFDALIQQSSAPAHPQWQVVEGKSGGKIHVEIEGIGSGSGLPSGRKIFSGTKSTRVPLNWALL